MGLTRQSPELLSSKITGAFSRAGLPLNSLQTRMVHAGIEDAQACFNATKGRMNLVDHIYGHAAPRNVELSRGSVVAREVLNINSSLFILLGFTLSVLDTTTLGMLNIDN